MTDVQERPRTSGSSPVVSGVEKRPLGWLTPVVWLVVLVAIGAIVIAGLSSNTDKKILFDSQKEHGWLVNAIFDPTSAGQKIFVMVFAIVLFLLVMGLILWLIDRPRVPNGVLVAGFLGPVIVALTGGLLFAALRTIYQSFRKFDQFGTDTGWSGFKNYSHFFNSANRDMLINTVLWVFLVPILATAFGLVYAVLVDRTRFEAAAKALIFLPTAISMVAASVIWKYVYYSPAPEGQSQIGLGNAVLTAFGGKASDWTLHFPNATFALIVVMIWIQAGFAMTVLSAAIKAVPDDIVEAAKIDGATGMRLFRSITIPTIRPTLVVVITTVAIAALKTFDIVNVMGGNLPGNNIIANAFYNNLSVQQYGLAGALAVLIFVIVSPIIVFNVIQMRKSEAIPMTTTTPPMLVVPEQQLSARKLKAQLRAADAKTKLSSPLASIIAIVIAILWTLPTLGLLVNSVRTGTGTNTGPSTSGWWTFFSNGVHFSFANYSNAWTGNGNTSPMSSFLLNTIVITLPAVFIPITLALLAAYAFAWIDFKGKNYLFIAVFAMQIVPIQVALIPLNTIYVKLGLNTSFWSIWLSHTVFGLPLAIFLLHNFMKEIPASLVEAARVDGAGHVKIFLQVLMPLLVPAIASFGIFQFLWVWNDLLVALTFSSDNTAPITRGIQGLTTQFASAADVLPAAAIIAMLVPLAVFLSLQRFFVRGLLAGSVKG